MSQKQLVLSFLEEKPQSHIKEISQELDILEPNIRRILGVGTKDGLFERIGSGVYKITIQGKKLLYLYHGDALKILPEMLVSGLKFDNIFLDIPYNTKAVKGGNRGVKYELMSVPEFNQLLNNCNQLLRNQESTITYMYSNAKSGLSEMQKYTDCFIDLGFVPVTKGEYYKLFKNGKPTTNMRGDIIEPEGIIIFSKVVQEKYPSTIKFIEKRPKGYQTEKPSGMIKELIELTTNENDVVLDPCCGSGVYGIEAIKINRTAHIIDKSENAIEYIIKSIHNVNRGS